MTLLIDTHVLLWWSGDPDRLPPAVLIALENGDNTVLLSLGSIWEMILKESLGKLRVTGGVRRLVESELGANRFEILPIREAHLWRVSELLQHHRDPFDRLLVAQAMVENATLVTADPAVRPYGVQLLW